MTKYIFLLLALPNLASAFIAEGRICSRPAIDPDGYLETSRIDQAKKLADQNALKHCYPFQYHRETDYTYSSTNDKCHSTYPYTIRETVTAEYSCAPH